MIFDRQTWMWFAIAPVLNRLALGRTVVSAIALSGLLVMSVAPVTLAEGVRSENATPDDISKTKQTYPIDPNNPARLGSLRLCESAMLNRLGGTSFIANVNSVQESFVSNAQLRYKGKGLWRNGRGSQQRYRFDCLVNIQSRRVETLTYTAVGNTMW